MTQPAKQPDRAALEKRAKALEIIANRKMYRALDFYTPYSKQKEFHDIGSMVSERYMRAGNRVGKSHCGAFEAACHLTGEYPGWWKGRKFTRPIKMWAASVTGIAVRDIIQQKLCGEPGIIAMQGTGMIPKEAVDWTKDTSLARGITDLYDTIAVQHRTNGVKDGKSILQFKTYEQGRQKWQGAAVDVIWFDEEPPEDVYFEGLARLAPTRPGDAVGISYLTSTPLLGITELVERFSQSNSDRAMVIMDMKDAAHMDAAAREVILARYAKHERAAREHGDPHMGGGLIFNTPAENLMEMAHSPLPAHWWYIWGIDFGIAHPFAAVLFGWDKDADVLHVVHAFRMKDAKPLEHCAAIKPYGQIPIAWPQDGTGRESNGETVASQYTKNGLPMLADHATFEDGGLSTEAGIMQMDERMTTGRWKVANHLKDWFEEYRTYHRDKGLIVKVRDDIMSASRVGMMMRRYAKRLPTFDPRGRAVNGGVRMATGLDYSIFE